MPPFIVAQPMTPDEFKRRFEAVLVNTYHGVVSDVSVPFVAYEGGYPTGLGGTVMTTVFPFEAVHDPNELNAQPHMLTAPGRVLTTELDPDARGRIHLTVRAVRNDAWHLRALAPNAFVRSDFAEFSWFGISDLTNTTPVPMFPQPGGGVRMLLSYDAGRPIEVDPRTFDEVSPIGRRHAYHAAVDSLLSPMTMTTGHPVYEPDEQRLYYVNIVPRVTRMVTVDRAITADLFVVTWDGKTEPTKPLRVMCGGVPVILSEASAHQLCVTSRWLVIFRSALVLDAASLLRPLSPVMRRSVARFFGGAVPAWLDHLEDELVGELRPAVQSPDTDVYFVEKRAIADALAKGSDEVAATHIRLEWELTHAVADVKDDGDVVTMFCQTNVGADAAQALVPGDALIDGGTAAPRALGMFAASTDLNQVRRHRVDARRGRVLETLAFPKPDSPEFPYGLNLLPPLDVHPYSPRGGRYDQLSAIDRWERTYWVAAGWTPATEASRVFDMYAEARGRSGASRLVPLDEYLDRARRPEHAAKFFALDRELNVVSCFELPPGYLMGAPIFVPRAGSESVTDGWLLAQMWRHDVAGMELWVWDAAKSLADGPICKLRPQDGRGPFSPGFPLHSSWVEPDGVAAFERPRYHVPEVEVPPAMMVAEGAMVVTSVVARLVRETLSRFR